MKGDSKTTTEIILEVVCYIEEHITEKLTVGDIAGQVYLSQAHLQRVFEFAFDVSIAEYVRSRKLQKSLEMLYETDAKISDIAYDIGFEHESSFIRSFKREFGITPGEARKRPGSIPVIPAIKVTEQTGWEMQG